VTGSTHSDDCDVCPDPESKVEAIITGHILIDPCLVQTTFYKCDGTNLGQRPAVKFGKGLATTATGTCDSSDGLITVNLDLIIDATQSAYAEITGSTCEQMLTFFPCEFL